MNRTNFVRLKIAFFRLFYRQTRLFCIIAFAYAVFPAFFAKKPAFEDSKSDKFCPVPTEKFDVNFSCFDRPGRYFVQKQKKPIARSHTDNRLR